LYIFIIVSAFIAILISFLPELFPSCSCCGKIKPRPFFKIHRAIGISPGYRGSKSVCIRCCRKYDINTIADLDKITDIKRKLKLQALAKNDL
jgi:hypothetical protein